MARLRVPAACRGGLLSLLGATVIPPPAGIQAAPAPADVAVVVSRGTAEADGWKQVVSALRFRHDAAVIVVDREPQEALPALRELMPRYACFVARPEEAGRVFVQQVSLLSRSLDDQPWGDLQWGIVTGRGPADAMTVARTTAPLVVRKALGGTAMDLGPFREGVWFNEGVRGERTVKSADGTVATRTEDQDTTEAIAAAFRDGPDLFLTSGHATERDWGTRRRPLGHGDRLARLEHVPIPQTAGMSGWAAARANSPESAERFPSCAHEPISRGNTRSRS